MPHEVVFLSDADVRAMLEMSSVIAAVEADFRRQADPEGMILGVPLAYETDDRKLGFRWRLKTAIIRDLGVAGARITGYKIDAAGVGSGGERNSTRYLLLSDPATSLPLAIILIVPMCILAALVGVVLAHLDNNIFVQIGLVVLIGLAAKNAILIVEFAKQQQDEGKSRYDATVEACKLRLRPILMTSFAFILGVVPLVLATGAGAEMRTTLGIAVFSGMLGVTIFGIFFTPVFYYVIRRFGERRGSKTATSPPDVTTLKNEPVHAAS